ncbi:MAG: hypothetical protein PHT59_00235 [Candidatus Omnitrophica bacterium]|nr:hypothetical protein [Candidatus Omnitrophota bacterium]
MRKTIAFSLFVLTGVCAASCLAGCAQKEKPAVTIDDIRITAQEFNDAFAKENMFQQGQLSRKEFLDLYLSRKLMLKEAEELGLDKDPQFLTSLQLFWEQALLKLVLARKLNELAVSARVSEEEIDSYYQRHKDIDYAGKELSEVHDQVKFLIFKIKQRLQLKNWESGLRRRAKIEVDYDLLNIPKE